MGALMIRLQDWPKRLDACINELRDKPFKWGEQDCGTFAADCIKAMTDCDVISVTRGQYNDADGANAVIDNLSFAGVRAATTGILGAPYPNPLFAKRGDIVAVDSGNGDALAVVALDGKHALAPAKRGLVQFAMSEWLCAWEV